MQLSFIRSITLNWDEVDEEDYLSGITSIRSLGTLEFPNNITFFVGENGTGKSTLLEAIAVSFGFNPEGGSMNFCFSSRDTHSGLHERLHLIKGPVRPKDGFFLRAESFYNVASEIEELAKFGDREKFLKGYGGTSMHELSHGESFLALAVNRFRGKGLYLLDEPEAALSPQRQLTLLIRIHQLAKEGSQFIIASHSPILLGMPKAAIYSFDDGGISPISYEETQSYQVTRLFLENKEQMLNKLLELDGK